MANFSLVFNGTSKATNENSVILENLTNMSVSMWVKSTTDNEYFAVKSAASGGSTVGWCFYIGLPLISVLFVGPAVGDHIYYQPSGASGVLDGNWHQIGFTKSGSTPKIYIDGVEIVGTPVIGGTPGDYSSGVETSFGASETATTFVGNMTLMYTYSRALSGAEMLTLATGGTPSATNLVNFYPCTDGSGNTVTDSNSVANLTLSNVTWSNDIPNFGISNKQRASTNLVF